MSDERVTIEAATRVIRAALAIVSEEQAHVFELESRIRHNMQAWTAPPDWEASQDKINKLLALCDEQDDISDEFKVPRGEGSIDVTAIREILAP